MKNIGEHVSIVESIDLVGGETLVDSITKNHLNNVNATLSELSKTDWIQKLVSGIEIGIADLEKIEEDLRTRICEAHREGSMTTVYLLQTLRRNMLLRIAADDVDNPFIKQRIQRAELDTVTSAHFLGGIFSDQTWEHISNDSLGGALMAEGLLQDSTVTTPDAPVSPGCHEAVLHETMLQEFLQDFDKCNEIQDQVERKLLLANQTTRLAIALHYAEESQPVWYLALQDQLLQQYTSEGYDIAEILEWCKEEPELAKELLHLWQKSYHVYFSTDVQKARLYIDRIRMVAGKLEFQSEILWCDFAETQLDLFYHTAPFGHRFGQMIGHLKASDNGGHIGSMLLNKAFYLLQKGDTDEAQDFIDKNLTNQGYWNDTWIRAASLGAVLSDAPCDSVAKCTSVKSLFGKYYKEDAERIMDGEIRHEDIEIGINIARYYFFVEKDLDTARECLERIKQTAREGHNYVMLGRIASVEARFEAELMTETDRFTFSQSRYFLKILEAYQMYQLLGADDLCNEVINQVCADIGISPEQSTSIIHELLADFERKQYLSLGNALCEYLGDESGTEFSTETINTDLSDALEVLQREILEPDFGINALRVVCLTKEGTVPYSDSFGMGEKETPVLDRALRDKAYSFAYEQKQTRTTDDYEVFYDAEPVLADSEDLKSAVGTNAFCCFNNARHSFPDGSSEFMCFHMDWGEKLVRLTTEQQETVKKLLHLVARVEMGESIQTAIAASMVLARQQEEIQTGSTDGTKTLLDTVRTALTDADMPWEVDKIQEHSYALRALMCKVLKTDESRRMMQLSEQTTRRVALHTRTLEMRRNRQIGPLTPDVLFNCKRYGIENLFGCSGDTNLLLTGTSQAMNIASLLGKQRSGVFEGCCGSGINLTKVLLEAEEFGIDRAYGLDLDGPSVEAVRRNFKKWQELIALGKISTGIPVSVHQRDVLRESSWFEAQRFFEGLDTIIFIENAPWVPSFDPDADPKVNSGGGTGLEFYRDAFGKLEQYFAGRELIININFSSLTNPAEFQALCEQHNVIPVALNYSLTKPTGIFQNGMWQELTTDPRFSISFSGDESVAQLVSHQEPQAVYWTINAVLIRQKPISVDVACPIPFEVIHEIHERFKEPGAGGTVIEKMLKIKGVTVSIESEELNEAFMRLALH